MGVRCFLCGKIVDDKEEKLIITTEYGDLANIIHRACYDYDHREPLDQNEVIKEKIADST